MTDTEKETLRQRGWSIQSTEDGASVEEKEEMAQTAASTQRPAPDGVDEHNAADGEEDIYDDLDEKIDQSKSNKKRSLPDADMQADDAKKPRIFELAKERLSKWAARLFDPDRPKGLIETPEIIPLKDTFLSEFGKREKEHDSQHGISLQIEAAVDDDDKQGDGDPAIVPAVVSNAKPDTLFKVKIANLKFTTTERTLQKACRKFGNVHSIVLVMDNANDTLNKGRATVTFTSEASGLQCVEKLTEIDGRKLRLTAANSVAAASNTGAAAAAAQSRYYTRDISTKCFRCGQVGHYSDDCPNERVSKPCAICSETDHDVRECPTRSVCFNCGIPGHVVRDCTMPRGQPQRRVCTICFYSGHFKEQCRTYANRVDVAGQAVCMICGVRGHFVCRDMQWYFGLSGVSCYNCGRTGHGGFQCDRPRVEDCSRNQTIGAAEVERAAAWSFAEDEINRRQRQDARGRSQQRQHTRFDSDPRRNQSMPPPPRARGSDSGSNGRQGQSSASESSGQNVYHPARLDQPLKASGRSRRL